MRKITKKSTPPKAEVKNPKKEFKIEIVKLGSLDELTGNWPAPGGPGMLGKLVYDRPSHSHSRNSTNSYF